MSRLSKWLAALLLAGFTLSGFAQKKKVLVLHSYHQGLSWTDNITRGMQSVFRQEKDIEVHFEYLDSKRNIDSIYFEELYQLYQTKHHDIPFEAILVSDNNALYFVRDHRDEFFKDIPLVFCAIDQFSDSLIAGMDKITGVTEQIDFRRTAELILQLHPNIQEVVIINDGVTVSARINGQHIRDFWPALNTAIRYRFISNVTIPELLHQVSLLNDSSVILLTNFSLDSEGHYISYHENIEMIRSATAVPVYSGWEFYLGKGIVGGMLTSGYDQGRLGANLVLEIIRGSDPVSLPIIRQGYNHLMFDYNQMVRYGLKPEMVPPGSIIINQPPTFMQKWGIWLLVLGVFVVLLITLVLLNERRNRRKAKRLLALNRELDRRVDQKTAALRAANEMLEKQKEQIVLQNRELDTHRHRLIDLVRERTAKLEAANLLLEAGRRRLLMMLDVSSDGVWEYSLADGAFRMSDQIWERLGYQKDQVRETIGFVDALIHPDDIALVQSKREGYIKGAFGSYSIEFRIKDTHGDWVWLLSRGKILEWDGKGVPSLLVGTHNDITKRKQAEVRQRLDEERLRASENRWRSLYEQVRESIVIADHSGHIIEANAAALHSLRYDNLEISRLMIGDLDTQHNNEMLVQRYIKPLSHEKNLLFYESQIKRKDGTLFPADVAFNLIDFSDGQFILVAIRDISRRQEVERQVLNAIIKTEEKERSRFARDLHDSIGPLLSSLKLYLATLAKTASDARRTKVFALSEEAINEAISSIREISNNLSPQSLTDFGLISALRNFVNRLNVANVIKASFEAEGMEKRLCRQTELALYRIVTEMINNTIKHSGASSLELKIERKKWLLHLLYRDNGQGMPQEMLQEEGGSGMGMLNIQTRVRSIDGKIVFSSQEDWGFVADLTLNMKKHRAE